jgi:hypothetical protein
MHQTIRRTTTAVAAAGAATVLVATSASAHHCYKENWTDAAYAQVSSGTAWMPMSGFVAFAIQEFFGLPAECAAHADEFTAAWQEANGVEQEPLIHTRATAGGGAADRNGKDVPPFNYLGDADFMFLESLIFAEPDCA